MGRERGGQRDPFPVGMRVLAVDDDPICLKILEAMLLHCQYNVTSTNQAVKALKLLRESKDGFDLVISDVHMPDMDGFKLLELVGLEMDLPVIMLSANGDTKAVLKGITHGACDYLLKPVRIEELKNIWQHVIRRKKLDSKDPKNFNNGEEFEKPQEGNSDGGQGTLTSESSERKINRKRKEQSEEGEDDNEQNLDENEDSCTQKKARVVWSPELHQKFMAAVDQIGIDKAVPKRILELMNVENLTRENVASHLQKYRLYIKKRVQAAANGQASLAAALGVRDTSYLPMASLDGYGEFHSLTASSQLPALPSFQLTGMLGHANPALLGLHGPSPGAFPVGRTYNNTSNLINNLNKFQHNTGSEHGSFLQGMPTKWELDQFQQHRIQELNNNSFASVMNNPLLLQAHHSSMGAAPMSSDGFDVGVGVSSCLPDLSRGNENCQGATPLSGYACSSVPASASANMVSSQMNGRNLNFSSNSAVPPNDPVMENMLLGSRGSDEISRYLSFRNIGNSRLRWDEVKQGWTHGPNTMFSSLNPSLPGQSMVDPISQNPRMNGGMHSRNMGANPNGYTTFSGPTFSGPNLAEPCSIEKSVDDGQLNYKDQHVFDVLKLQGGLSPNGCSLDDLMNAMIKPEQKDGVFMDR